MTLVVALVATGAFAFSETTERERGTSETTAKDDHRPQATQRDVWRGGVWSVGADDHLVHVERATLTHDYSMNHTWWNWTLTSRGGDVRLTTYPPGCSSESCSLVDTTENGPATRNLSDPPIGVWNRTIVSMTASPDPDQVRYILEDHRRFYLPPREG